MKASQRMIGWKNAGESSSIPGQAFVAVCLRSEGVLFRGTSFQTTEKRVVEIRTPPTPPTAVVSWTIGRRTP